ncbi:hypothetical protein [Pseudomonas sp. dw_358]|uniref:hypothetical protein n=1 Tax=Pseudomonas sp. dw_358 TaxID=2720083 RepID=UPI001BD5B66C
MPYLPIDPAVLGRSYEAVIRVNSQSGKGGVAYLLEQHGIALPRRLQMEFSGLVQKIADETGVEITSEMIFSSFNEHYLKAAAPFVLNQTRRGSEGCDNFSGSASASGRHQH